MCKHGFHFIHEMHYSSIAYFQGVMTGKGVKREAGVWSWQEARPDPLYFLSQRTRSSRYSLQNTIDVNVNAMKAHPCASMAFISSMK